MSFLITHPGIAFAILGSVCLAVTGAEALYADLGHFGRKPIRVAWGTVVFPALALNYLGQGALVLSNPDSIDNPFFLLAPPWLLLPLVILATLATIVASQAVITGAYLADPAGDPARPAAAPGSALHLGDAIRGRSTCRA